MSFCDVLPSHRARIPPLCERLAHAGWQRLMAATLDGEEAGPVQER